MSLKFIDLTLIFRLILAAFKEIPMQTLPVLPAKPKEKEPALSVCKLFSLCRSGCSALGFSFSRSGPDSAVPAPQTVHRPQAPSRETPSFPSRFSRSDANGLCNHRNDVCNTIITQQKKEPPSQPSQENSSRNAMQKNQIEMVLQTSIRTGSNVFVISSASSTG